ncbi:MAG: DEAD/DEAH box helicase [Gemmatimonadetes bacterium]|nr:DEAD/DEAH box helicase [Gemmatimonadota bacterium]
MLPSGFHPAVSRWFAERLGEPTPAQSQGWEAIRSGRHTLISAPTGSGKTLAAFLNALDELLREGLEHGLPDETRVVYVSPLKALSADIHKNLAEPRRQIRQVAEAMGLPSVRITAAVRTGDTPARERTAMLASPPHILVTTPESLYLLLTAERSRGMLRTVRTVIVDEIHAVIGSRRGSHLALSLERLQHVARRPLLRIGLSATQKPIDEVARFLVGAGGLDDTGDADCAVVDQGHRRAIDLGVEIPDAPLEAVMSGEIWETIYDRLARLIAEHRTTLVFVNTRRMAERVARHLSERVGLGLVTSHHGSLSKEARLDAETRLKEGQLKALVATASLELGIDIGSVDLVCQLGSTRQISTFLQRVGRSGHTVRGTPKGRLFPLSRDDLIECAALVRSVRRGELDRLIMPQQPLDVLAQQVVAEAACEDWPEDDLYALARRAYPYRNLSRGEFDDVVGMVAQGFTTRRGRRGALVHRDAIHHRLRGRRGARLAAITSGGAIPDTADYRVVLEPDELFLGAVNEDFAVESMAGEVFQLGNRSWRILRIEQGTIRVADAEGELPSIPFWLGEAPGRTLELSAAVSEVRREVGERLDDPEAACRWLMAEVGLSPAAARQIVEYLKATRHLLGVIPAQETIVAERFFDEAGGMQLVIHAPFGSRINRAWGLALRKRFCRQFNFELQAAATEDGLLLSLGPQHSFPLGDVFRYLHPTSVRDVLVQALLDAPMFQLRWRWNATISLALLRNRGGRRVPPQIQRMEADDLLAAVFPDAAACLENIAGDREIPDHPLVRQTLADALHEAMDLDGLVQLLRRIHAGEIACLARDVPEPSPLTHEILNARPYAFLDDAPLEERRAQAVATRRASEPTTAAELGALDPAAIARVREEAWPEAGTPDELHDALLLAGFLTVAEGAAEAAEAMPSCSGLLGVLQDERRAGRASVGERTFWVTAERLGELRAVHGGLTTEPASLEPPSGAVQPDRETAIRELLRSRLEILGPTTAAALAESLGVGSDEAEIALVALEREGAVLRGRFTDNGPRITENVSGDLVEWCDRRLLARIHRYTLHKLRAEIEPVSAAEFMRYLFVWQRLVPEHRAAGLEGLAAVLEQLDGFELAAGAWETDVLASRVDEYDPLLLDALCLTGRVAWGRLSLPAAGGGPRSGAERGGPAPIGPVRSTPVAVLLREHRDAWLSLAAAQTAELSAYGIAVRDALARHGALFFPELVARSGLLATQVERALAELVAAGLVTADSFAGLRALLVPAEKRRPMVANARRRHGTVAFGVDTAGRWALLRGFGGSTDRRLVGVEPDGGPPDRRAVEPPFGAGVELFARTLLRRYGVVFHRLLARESLAPPWRDLLRVYRRLEARGEIRGGRFVAGMSGEQFALPEAVGRLRAIRRSAATGELVSISAADPLNLTGIVTPEARVPALASNRVLFREGVPISVRQARETRHLVEPEAAARPHIERALVRKRVSPALRAYLGSAG